MAAGSLYFRAKDNGALVFRITEDTNSARTELVPIATAVLRSGEIRLHSDAMLADGERVEILDWIETRKKAVAKRKRQGVDDLADELGMAAQWVKAEATDRDIEELGDRLLWGMHDLRSALIRRLAQRKDAGE